MVDRGKCHTEDTVTRDAGKLESLLKGRTDMTEMEDSRLHEQAAEKNRDASKKCHLPNAFSGKEHFPASRLFIPT